MVKLPLLALDTAVSEEKPTSWKSPDCVCSMVDPGMPDCPDSPGPCCEFDESDESELDDEDELESELSTGWKKSVLATDAVNE